MESVDIRFFCYIIVQCFILIRCKSSCLSHLGVKVMDLNKFKMFKFYVKVLEDIS